MFAALPVAFRERVSAQLEEMPANTLRRPPREVEDAIGLLAGYLRKLGSCRDDATFQVACPAFASVYGTDLEAIVEALRLHSLLRTPGFCNSTFVTLRYSLRNSPGALLQQISSVHRAMLGLASELKSKVQLLAYQQRTMLGPLFMPIAMSFPLARPCREEVEAFCGRSLASRTFTYHEWRGLADKSAVFPSLLRTPHRPWHMVYDRWHKMDKPQESEIGCQGAHRVRAAIERMRRLLPISSPVVPYGQRPVLPSGGRAIEIAVHVRGGSGTKSPPELAFMPLVDRLQRVFAARHRRVRVHVVHEVPGNATCCRLFQERSRHDPSIHVHIDKSRYAYFQTMWNADILISGRSKFSHLIGQISPHIKVVYDAALLHGCHLEGTTHVRWLPCAKRLRWSRRPEECTPVVGVADADVDDLIDRVFFASPMSASQPR